MNRSGIYGRVMNTSAKADKQKGGQVAGGEDKADIVDRVLKDGQRIRAVAQDAKIDVSCLVDWIEECPTFAGARNGIAICGFSASVEEICMAGGVPSSSVYARFAGSGAKQRIRDVAVEHSVAALGVGLQRAIGPRIEPTMKGFWRFARFIDEFRQWMPDTCKQEKGAQWLASWGSPRARVLWHAVSRWSAKGAAVGCDEPDSCEIFDAFGWWEEVFSPVADPIRDRYGELGMARWRTALTMCLLTYGGMPIAYMRNTSAAIAREGLDAELAAERAMCVQSEVGDLWARQWAEFVVISLNS